MNATYGAQAVLNALSLHQYKNVYFLGPYAERASFASQQRRALNLVWALQQSEPISGKRIAIIGAGLAGITAAAAAVAGGAAVWQFERQDYICSLQRKTYKRFIHPTINFWPDEPLKPTTDWPFLNWFAAPPCHDVIAEVETQWKRYFAPSVDPVMTEVTKIAAPLRPACLSWRTVDPSSTSSPRSFSICSSSDTFFSSDQMPLNRPDGDRSWRRRITSWNVEAGSPGQAPDRRAGYARRQAGS
jgi:hypothetical protein